MTHVKNPMTGEIRYVTKSWAYWLKSYGWVDATFEEFMQAQWLKAIECDVAHY